MARSQNSFNKKEKEKKRLQKRKEKQQKKEDRKVSSQGADSSLAGMMAYVDENGNIMDSPPDPTRKKEEVNLSSIEIAVPKQQAENLASRRGRVTYFDTNKGYGFISQDGTQERFFVHSSSLSRPVQEGDKVSFVAKRGVKGMDAINVKVI